jgi:hypothetical protein
MGPDLWVALGRLLPYLIVVLLLPGLVFTVTNSVAVFWAVLAVEILVVMWLRTGRQQQPSPRRRRRK